MLGVQILLPLPLLPHTPLLFMDASPQQLWEAFVSLQLLVESCSSSADGCEPLGRVWLWMEFKGCGETHTARLPLPLAGDICHR